MIYNNDFVTNSSSTSFILFIKNEESFTLSKFLNALKTDPDSPLAIIYKELFKMIKDNMEPANNIKFEELNLNYRFFDEFSKEGAIEIKRRLKNGEQAYIGTISDDSAVGGYFMGKKIIIIDDTFYFNWEADAY